MTSARANSDTIKTSIGYTKRQAVPRPTTLLMVGFKDFPPVHAESCKGSVGYWGQRCSRKQLAAPGICATAGTESWHSRRGRA